MLKQKTILIIFLSAILTGLIVFFAVNYSLETQLSTMKRPLKFDFPTMTMEIREIKLDTLACFMVTYDRKEISKEAHGHKGTTEVFFNCPQR